jgi:hypothetical protein
VISVKKTKHEASKDALDPQIVKLNEKKQAGSICKLKTDYSIYQFEDKNFE